MKVKLLKFIIIQTVTLLIFSTFPKLATATDIRIYLQPSNNIYDTTTAYAGMKFNVSVWVENAPDIGGIEISMEFNDDVINVTRWFAPTWDANFCFYGLAITTLPTPPNPGYVHTDPNMGSILVAVNKGGLPPTAPWGHSGLACILEFVIKAVPTEPGTKLTSILHIDNPSTYLLDPEASEIPDVIKEDGYYEISKPAPPPPPEGSRIFIDPPEIIDPTAVPCVTNFDINVTIDDIANMKAGEFNLTYDPGVISFIAISFLKVNGQYPMPGIEADDIAGFIWIKLTYSTVITVTNPTPLVTLKFHVRNLGATPLNLTHTKITDPTGNVMPHDVYHGFFAALIRDIAVTNILPSRSWAYQGWPVNITVTVKNNGDVSETFNLSVYYDDNLIGTKTVTDLASNEERNVIFEWDTTGVVEGNYTIKAVADTVPYETNTSDNILIDGKVGINVQIHDVAIVSITLSSDWVYHGWVAKINVTAKNLGAFNETFDIIAYYNNTIPIGIIHIDNLSPSETSEVQFNLDTSPLLECHTYVISAEATVVPYEFNETNNVLVNGGLKVRFYGDLNGDDRVNLQDYFAVALSFGSYPGHPKWNPYADLNQDLKIDLKDIFAVAINFGKGCTP